MRQAPANVLSPSIILVGLLVSYLPQHYRIVARGTSEGISPWFVLLGTTSATAGFANILTVPPSRRDIQCCSELGTFECAAGLLGIAQLGVQWISFALMYVLHACQRPQETNFAPADSSSSSYTSATRTPMSPMRSSPTTPLPRAPPSWSAPCA